MPSAYLIRHAQASFGSFDYDVLSLLGLRQAGLLDAAMADRGVRADRVLAGTMRRQIDTARACPNITDGHELETDPRWNEYDSADVMAVHGALDNGPLEPVTGAPSGMSSPAFQLLLDAALTRWIEAGESSACRESWPAFSARVRAALRQVVARLGSGETAVVFSSGGAIAAVAAGLLGASPQAFVAINRMTVNTGVARLLCGRSGIHLLTLGDHGHLAGHPELSTFR